MNSKSSSDDSFGWILTIKPPGHHLLDDEEDEDCCNVVLNGYCSLLAITHGGA